MTQRTRRDFNTLGVPVLGVTRGERSPRAQSLQIVEFEPVSTQIELHVLGEGTVAHRKNKAVAADPGVVRRIATHDLLKQEIGSGSEANSGSGMTVAHLLNGICCQYPSSIYGPIVTVIPFERGHVRGPILLMVVTVIPTSSGESSPTFETAETRELFSHSSSSVAHLRAEHRRAPVPFQYRRPHVRPSRWRASRAPPADNGLQRFT